MTETINAKTYLHAGKGDYADDFEELFPNASEEAKGNAWRFGYEVAFDGYWNDEGEFWATHVEGVKLERPVLL